MTTAAPAPTRRAPRWRRRLLRAALCLLLGAVTTVGVAWLLTPGKEWDPGPNYVVDDGEHRLSVTLLLRRGACYRDVVFEPTTGAGAGPLSIDSGHLRAAFATLEARRSEQPVPWRETDVGRMAMDDGWGLWPDPGEECTSIAVGLPLLAVWGAERRPATAGPRKSSLVRQTIDARETGFYVVIDDAPYPIIPIWPGFLLDTLFYAAAWWALLAAPGLVKRWRRKRRGACLACGYDLRGLGDGAACPECGT